MMDLPQLQQWLEWARSQIGTRDLFCPNCIGLNVVKVRQPSVWDAFWGGLKTGAMRGAVGSMTGTSVVGVVLLDNGQYATHACRDCGSAWQS